MTSRHPFTFDPFFPGEGVSKDVLAIFWDMENVPAPFSTSPISVARLLRSQLGRGYKALDLNFFCNVSRVRTEMLCELLNENVTLVHVQVNSSKEKLSFMLQQFLNRRQFSCLHLVLVSEDKDLLGVIEKARSKSIIRVIFASNNPSPEVSTVSFGVCTSFSAFVEALRESFMRSNKQAIVRAQHEEGQYQFSSYTRFENRDFELTNEDPSLEWSCEEEAGDSHIDAVSEQITVHSDPPSERPEAQTETTNQFSPSSSHQVAERACRAEDGRNLKSKLLNALRENRVVLVVRNPGSGSGLDVAVSAQELGHRVLSIQPTDIEARICATYAGYGRTLANVDCWLFHGQEVDPQATVVFTTASLFFQMFQNTGKEVTGFQTIIVDGINEDNVYQRVIVNILQRYLQSDVTLIFCSTGLDVPLSVQESFHFGADNIVNCDVRFPVRVIWKEPSQDKLRACIDAVLEFCSAESPGGDILVFVPTVADALEGKSLLENHAKSLSCEVMYAGMIPLPSIENSPHALWKVYFTVDCPDVSASLLNIRCVVDCGVVSTTALEGGIFVKEFRFLCAAEAEERRSLAAIRGEGTCYHVYSESELLSSCPSFTTDLRYMEDVVLRLSAGKTDANTLFLEDVPKQLREEAKSGLQEIGAMDMKGQVTDLGKALCLISAEPRLGKLLFGSIGRLSTLDAILLSILALEDLCAPFKGPRKQSGSPEVPLSEDSCDFAYIIQIYKAWCSVPKNQKTTWCDVNMLNDLFFDNLHSKATCAYSEFLKLRTHQPFQRNSEQHRYSVVTIGNILSECFPSGLLQVTEQGCQHPTLGKDMKMSRFSLLQHKLQPKGMAICCLFSRDQHRATLEIMNACILPGDSKCSPHSSNALSSTSGTEATNIHQRAVPLGSLIGNGRYSHLHVQQFLEKELSGSSEIRKEEGSAVLDVARQHVLLVGTERYCAAVGESLERFNDKLLMELKTEDREVVLTPAMSPFGRRPVQGVIGRGGRVLDVFSAAAFRTITVRDARLSVVEIEKQFQQFGSVVKFECENEYNACHITYKTAGEANAAYIACKNEGGMTVEAKDQALRCRNDLAGGNAPLKIVVSFRPRINTLSASTDILQHCQLQEDVASEQNTVKFASASASSMVVKHGGEKQCVGVNSQSPAQGLERDAAFSSCDIVSWNIKEILSAELGPQTPELKMEDQIDPNGCIKGYLLFWDPEAAERALALLHEKQCRLHSTHSQSGPSKHLPVEVFVEGRFFLPLPCFSAIEGEFLEKMFERNKRISTDHCDYEASTYGNLVFVTLRARYWQGYEDLVHILCVVLQGTKIIETDVSVHSQHVEKVIKGVAYPDDVYVIYKSGGVHLLGYKQAVQRVTEVLGGLAHNDCFMETLDLVSKRSTRLRSFLARFGDDLGKFVSECGLYDARFDTTLQCIEVYGRWEAVEKAKNLMRELQAEKDVRPHSKAVEESCSICHLPPLCSTGGDVKPRKVHRMESCGHLHCVPCLTLALKFAPLPLTCFHPNCGALWVIADVSQVTGDDLELLSTLARRSVKEKLSTYSLIPWMPCPTPECAFVWNTENSAESQGIQVCKELHICPGCRNPVCFRCQSLFHYGMPCGQQESVDSTTCRSLIPTREKEHLEHRVIAGGMTEMVSAMRRQMELVSKSYLTVISSLRSSGDTTTVDVMRTNVEKKRKLMDQRLRGEQEDASEEIQRNLIYQRFRRAQEDASEGTQMNLMHQLWRGAQEDASEVTGATKLRQANRSLLETLQETEARVVKEGKQDKNDECVMQ